MGHLHMRRQGLKSTKVKPPYTDLEDKIKTSIVFCTNVDPSTTKEGKKLLRPMQKFPHHIKQCKKIHLRHL